MFFRATILFFLMFFGGRLFGKTNLLFFANEKRVILQPIILIYPDSACTSYFISTGQEFATVVLHVDLIDLGGRIVFTGNIQGGGSSKISVGEYADGVYFLRLVRGDELICIRKIVVYH